MSFKIDFSGLDLDNPGTAEWQTVRGQVEEALKLHGWIEAIYDKVTPELHETFFEEAVKVLFSLPVETKQQNISNKTNHGYIGQLPGLAYEAMCIEGAHSLPHLQDFTSLMWPHGNPIFCKTVHEFVEKTYELEKIVRKMILENLGVENDQHFKNQTETLTCGLRFAEYGAPGLTDKTQTKTYIPPHTDPTTISIVSQYRVEGLEVPAINGGWMRLVPSPSSFIVLIGESFEAWSNGRVKASEHVVSVGGDEKRYSVVLATYAKDGEVIEVPEELVDGEHPLLYEPFEYRNYVNFRYSIEGGKAGSDVLKKFCGIAAAAAAADDDDE